MRTVTDLGELIDGFRLYCLAEGKAPKTIGWYIPKLVYMRQYLEDNGLPGREGYAENNPARLLRAPKTPAKIVETFSGEQIQRLLAAVDIKQTNGFRDLCMMLLFLDTGIRL